MAYLIIVIYRQVFVWIGTAHRNITGRCKMPNGRKSFNTLKNSGEKQDVVVQEKDPDRARQNLWLSGENRSGGSVGRTQRPEL